MQRPYTPALLALSALLGGFAAVHVGLPSVAVAQEATPPPSGTDAGRGMKPIIDRMENRLAVSVSGSSDRQYVAAMAAISPAIVAACKREIRDGSDLHVRTAAQKS